MMCGSTVAGIQPWGALLTSQICNKTKKQTEPKIVHIYSDDRDDGVSVREGSKRVVEKAVIEVK